VSLSEPLADPEERILRSTQSLSVTSGIQFDKALVTDGLAWALFGMAKREGLLDASEVESSVVGLPGRSIRQAALTLLLMFDKVVVHDLSLPPGEFRIPALEHDGLLEIVPALYPSRKPLPLLSTWKPTTFDRRGKPPVSLRRDLALMRTYRPFIINRLLTVRN
jgi:hypothetical protein